MAKRRHRSARRARAHAPASDPAAHAPSAPLPRARNGAAALPWRISAREGQWLLAVAVLVALSYFPALRGGFVWDDVIFSEEPVIHSAGGLRSIWFSPADIRNEGHYWPLVYTTFWLEHKI